METNESTAIEMLNSERIAHKMNLTVALEKINELEVKNKELEELVYSEVTNSLEHFRHLVDKYSDLSWKIEAITISADVSESHTRELVRELLYQDAKERYNKALTYFKESKGIDGYNDNVIATQYPKTVKSIKIASGYEENT